MKLAIGLILVLVVIAIVIFVFPSLLTKTAVNIVETSVDESRAAGRDGRRAQDINSLKIELDLYFEKFNSFPQTLAELKSTAVNSRLINDILTGDVYKQYFQVHYATVAGAGGKIIAYHLGQSFESERSQKFLTQDNDFDSKSAGWLNGFNGTDSQACGTGDYGKFCYDIKVEK